MSALQFNAHDVCRTRLCQAANCEDDAINGWPLCERCDRRHRAGVRVPLHVQPPPLPPSLKCSKCHQWKPDADYPMRGENDSGHSAERRGRRHECRACDTTRRRAWRDANREATNARQRARRARGGS